MAALWLSLSVGGLRLGPRESFVALEKALVENQTDEAERQVQALSEIALSACSRLILLRCETHLAQTLKDYERAASLFEQVADNPLATEQQRQQASGSSLSCACWDPAKWPIHDAVRRDPLVKTKPILIRYDDSDPSKILSEEVLESDRGLPADGLASYAFVEAKLSKLLS